MFNNYLQQNKAGIRAKYTLDINVRPYGAVESSNFAGMVWLFAKMPEDPMKFLQGWADNIISADRIGSRPRRGVLRIDGAIFGVESKHTG